ncbi:MAG: hypothetical protein ACT4OK_01560 [Gemmobacter sp.]
MIKTVLGATGVALFAAGMAVAGPIGNACLKSDRKAASRSLCGCIQQAADQTLSGSDQRRVAKFFNDPEAVQKVKLSDTDRDDEFWTRYRAFSDTAQGVCAG